MELIKTQEGFIKQSENMATLQELIDWASTSENENLWLLEKLKSIKL